MRADADYSSGDEIIIISVRRRVIGTAPGPSGSPRAADSRVQQYRIYNVWRKKKKKPKTGYKVYTRSLIGNRFLVNPAQA